MCAKAYKAPRQARSTDLLSSAHASEINWDEASWMLRGRRSGDVPFVYFVGEQDDGPVKIGHALDPISRLRALQVGNPRRLRIERLIYGDRETEHLVHEYWREYAVGGKVRRAELEPQYAFETEWFAAEARARILDAAEDIAIAQYGALYKKTTNFETLDGLVGKVMTELGYEIKRGDEVRFLARGAGYVVKGLRP